MSKRISIVGPDGSGKSTLLENLVKTLGEDWEVLDRPSFSSSSSYSIRLAGNLSDGLIKIGSRRESKRLVAIGAMLNPPLYILADKQDKQKITLSTLDPWIDVQVYCRFYFPNMNGLVSSLARSFYRPASHIIYLQAPVDVCMKRLTGEPQLHENEDSLRKISSYYEQIVSFVARTNMSRTCRIDTSILEEKEVYARARDYLFQVLKEQ